MHTFSIYKACFKIAFKLKYVALYEREGNKWKPIKNEKIKIKNFIKDNKLEAYFKCKILYFPNILVCSRTFNHNWVKFLQANNKRLDCACIHEYNASKIDYSVKIINKPLQQQLKKKKKRQIWTMQKVNKCTTLIIKD